MAEVFQRVSSLRLAPHFSLILLAILTAGCSHSYLYNAQRDKQGLAATKAASEVKLVDTVAAVEKRFQGLLDLELDAAKNRYALIRELEIRELAYSTKPTKDVWLPRIQNRLKAVIGDGNWDHVEMARGNLRIEEQVVKKLRDAFAGASGKDSPDCSTVSKNETIPEVLAKSIRQSELANVRAIYRQLRSNCATYLRAQAAYKNAFNETAETTAGAFLNGAARQLKGDEEEKAENEAVRKKAQAELKAAIIEYDAASKTVVPADTKGSVQERLTMAAEKLRTRLEKLEESQGKIGKEVVAKERLDKLEEVLTGVAGGQVDSSKWSESFRQAIGVAGTLPSLVDESKKNLLEASRPRLVPYVLAREHQRLVVEEATNVNAVLEQRIHASKQVVEAYENEIRTLIRVRTLIPEKWHGKSLHELNEELPAADKRVLYELLGIYFDDVARYQRDQHLWEYRRLATFQNEAIEHSKYAALMWQNLIDGIANTLSGFHGSGIKPEDIAEFLKAAGVIYIGVGVNK